MTDLTLRFVMMRALLISFIAKYCFAFFRSTRHTFPKPPFPMQKWYTKFAFDTAAHTSTQQLVNESVSALCEPPPDLNRSTFQIRLRVVLALSRP